MFDAWLAMYTMDDVGKNYKLSQSSVVCLPHEKSLYLLLFLHAGFAMEQPDHNLRTGLVSADGG